MLRQEGDVLPVQEDFSPVREEAAGDGPEEGRLPRPVAADDGDKIPLCQGEGKVLHRLFFVDGAGGKGFGNVLQTQ